MLKIPLFIRRLQKEIDRYRRAGIQPKVALTLGIPLPFQNRLKLSSEFDWRVNPGRRKS
jgi:hypothetical protein